MTEFLNATPQEVRRQRGTSYGFGMPLVDAVTAGYLLPPGSRIITISDSRVGEKEAQRMGELMNIIHGKTGTRRVLSLFDGAGSTSYAIARALPGAQVTGIDNDHEIHVRGKHNIQHAGLMDRVTLIEADALTYLDTAGEFDAIFIDPLWPDDPERYRDGRPFSLTETIPPLTDIIPAASKHSSLIVARIPLVTDIPELTAMGERLRKELFIDTNQIEEPGGMKTKAAFFAETGQLATSTRTAVFDPSKQIWETTAYQGQQ